MNMKYIWTWPLVIVLSTLLVGLVVLTSQPLFLRIPVSVWFLLVIPGMAYVRLLTLKDPLSEWTLAVALSLALDALVSLTMIYIHRWSPDAGLRALMLISLVGAAVQAWRAIRARRPVKAVDGKQADASINSMVEYFIQPTGLGLGGRALRLLVFSLGVLTFFGGLALIALLALRIFVQ